jgi:DNA-binding beta-propeller fold protein YncE
MKRHLCFTGLLAVLVVIGVVVSGTSLAARPRPVIAGQAPPVVLRPDLTIGVGEGDESLMFGRIVRIDVDGRGNIYVLDYRYRRVSVFDKEGKLLRAVAVPAGQGPREATNLSGIAVTPGGTLFVNDKQKVIVYGPDGAYVRTFLVEFMISSIGCAGEEELVAIGPHEGKILHVFDPQGRLLASFGDVFVPPGDLEPMKEMPMFGAPLLFNCAKDGRIFVLNPHKYEVSVFKDRKLEQRMEGRNEAFKPLRKMGRAVLSTAAHIVTSGDLVFVTLQMIDPRAKKTADVFRDGDQIGSIEIGGVPYAADPQGRIYVAEEDEHGGYPKVVRYVISRE